MKILNEMRLTEEASMVDNATKIGLYIFISLGLKQCAGQKLNLVDEHESTINVIQ